MGFFGKIFRSKSVVTLLAIALCTGILIFAYIKRVDKAIDAVEIPVAVKRLNAREQITEDCIRMVKVARTMITSNVITNKTDILEKYVNYNTIIPEGSVFYSSAVVSWDKMPDAPWKNIEEGNTVVSLSFNSNVQAYANSLYPGDKIDLYFEGTIGDKSVISKLVEGIEILAVKDDSGAHVYKKSPEQKSISALIFSVPEKYHLLIKRANALGTLIPVPRNSKYSKETNITSDYLLKYIKSQYTNKTLGDEEITIGSGGSITVTE